MNERGNPGDERRTAAASARTTESAGREAGSDEERGVLTLVCVKCGTEYYFQDGEAPEEMSCEKCRATVFRSFYSAGEGNEALEDFDETTGRDLDPDDPEGDTRPGDVLDLRRG